MCWNADFAISHPMMKEQKWWSKSGPSLAGQEVDNRQQIANTRQHTADSRQQIADSRQQTAYTRQ
jgi:hypothetical protein